MGWPTAQNDLRVALSDGPLDRLRSQKRVFGVQNGGNTIFKTEEHRRTTNLSATGNAAFPCGVYVDGAPLSPTLISIDDPQSGYFQLVSSSAAPWAPSAGPLDSNKVTATYYAQYFLDTDLAGFLSQAATWLGMGTDATQISTDFISAAMEYAKGKAYDKLSQLAAENLSQSYQLEDAPDTKNESMVDVYRRLSQQAMKNAYTARDDVYTRKGQSKAPRFASISGNVKNPTRS